MQQRVKSRLAPAVVALLVLAACGGGENGDGAPIDPPAEGSSSGSSGSSEEIDLRSPVPVELVDGGSTAVSSATAEAVPASDDAATSDMRIAQWVVDYVVGDGFPGLPIDDTGYVFDAATEVTAEEVAALGAAFGVGGEPIRIDEGFGVNWRIGPDDGSAAGIWVSSDGQHSWNYNAPWSEGVIGAPCAVSVDADGNESSDCPEPEPPAGVPGAAEAEQRARDLLASLGVDASALTIEARADEWFAGVEASDRSDARAATRSWSFGFVGDGVLQFASGSLRQPEPVGPYPLVDLETAVARLTDGYFGGFGGGAIAGSDLAVVSGVAPEPVETVEAVEAAPAASAEEPPSVEPAPEAEPDESMPVESMPVESMPVEPAPVEPEPVEPEPDPVVVTLVDVQADLWWAWDADGSVWLLPAYRFIDTDGGWHVVPAVSDEFLIRSESVVDDPLPAPEPLPAPAPDAPDEVAPEPGVEPEAISALEPYIGLSIEEFSDEAHALGFTTRVVRQDGEALAVTADYSSTRVNVEVEDQRVVAIQGVG